MRDILPQDAQGKGVRDYLRKVCDGEGSCGVQQLHRSRVRGQVRASACGRVPKDLLVSCEEELLAQVFHGQQR